MKVLYILLILLLAHSANSQNLTAVQVIDKSIAFHDPMNNWESFEENMLFETVMADSSIRKRKVNIDNKNNRFEFWGVYDEGTLNYKVNKEKGVALWNGSDTYSDETKEKYRIATERAIMYRNYYTYLYGMPMKLKDPGTIITPDVSKVEFYGKEYYRVKVNYTEGVGDDIWYFYFDPNTYALGAYQFFHDEAKNDGEYILFEEIIIMDNIKIPKIRHWYYNKDNKFLASDILVD